jgi:ParB/RepB/Spo0J family partition protein
LEVEIVDILLENIEPNPWNPRTIYEDTAMDELINSIEKFGVLQPIMVRPHPTKPNKYQIIYGQRRWTASKKLGLKTIPVKEPIIAIPDKDAIEIMGDENVKRQAYSPIELAEYFKTRRTILGETQAQLAKKYEVSHDTISLIEKLNKLPEEIKPKVTWGLQKYTRENRIHSTKQPLTYKHALELTRLPDEEKQIEMAKKIETEGLTTSQIKKEIDKELGIERAEISMPSLSEQFHQKTLWNLNRLDLSKYSFFTIGYSERDILQFSEILKKAGVKILIDARAEPHSMYKPEFNKDNLSIVLSQDGIKYVHHPELGAPKEQRLKLAKSQNWASFFAWYDSNILPELDNIGFESLEKPFAIMCLELDPTHCHRHRIALYLEKRGMKGFDL